ncbi:hypothetical protein [Aneurinibacillus uraniidurans]|uniref:hypothetical protein n=1 Tax=Aneurinibacillus uraniidurans TaxID=2966586 RepID=UPI00234BC132|nr:hypothetical protein [Aneurinibacillus sp. B1]WCN39251.1 hypothetical protein PO771_07615 [Aneurinibacillus sp. B1]
MIIPTILGILAVVILILIIFFNTKAMSNQPENKPDKTKPHKDETKQQETVIIKDEKPMEKNPTNMLDEDYRDALRQFQTQGNKSSQVTAAAEPTTERIQDEEYRNALRSMTNQKQPNHSDDRESER